MKTPKHTIIRMGAAHWDATIPTTKGEVLHFNLRKMTKDQRREFHSNFMWAYRSVNPMKPRERKLAA